MTGLEVDKTVILLPQLTLLFRPVLSQGQAIPSQVHPSSDLVALQDNYIDSIGLFGN